MFKSLAAVSAMALLGAPTPADMPVQTGQGTRYFAGDPPSRFVKEGAAIVVFIHPAKINEACGLANPKGLTLIACVRRDGDTPIIFMPHPAAFPNDPYAQIMLHEGAHAWGGWDGTHPL